MIEYTFLGDLVHLLIQARQWGRLLAFERFNRRERVLDFKRRGRVLDVEQECFNSIRWTEVKP